MAEVARAGDVPVVTHDDGAALSKEPSAAVLHPPITRHESSSLILKDPASKEKVCLLLLVMYIVAYKYH
jgi:hypothetical protein